MRSLRARGIRRLCCAFGVAIAFSLLLARANMPFTRLNGLGVPLGLVLTIAPVLALCLSWRDVGAPVSSSSARPRWHEWCWQAGLSIVLTVVAVAMIGARVYPISQVVLVPAFGLVFLGSTMLACSFLGVNRGVLVPLGLFFGATVLGPAGAPFTWPYLPSSVVPLTIVGLLLTLAGTAVAVATGLDGRHLNKDSLVGVNDS